MRALITTPPGPALVAEVDTPQPAPGEVLVRVSLSAICPHDRPIMSGRYHAVGLITLPTVGLGWDLVGEVIEVNGVEGFAAGDRVAGTVSSYDLTVRSIAEYVAVPAHALAQIPAGVSDEDAVVSLISGLTATQALALVGSARGDLLITAAAGNVGAYAIALAVSLGFTVTGLAREGDREFVESLGATFVAALDGSFDVVLDAAGFGADAVGVVRDGGHYVGVHPGGEPQSQRGVTVAAVEAEPDGEQLAHILSMVEDGRARARVIDVVSMERAAELMNAPAEPGLRGRYAVRS